MTPQTLNKFHSKVLSLLIILLVMSCGTYKKASLSTDFKDWEKASQSAVKELKHSLFLVGDAGELDDTLSMTNIVVEALKKRSNR